MKVIKASIINGVVLTFNSSGIAPDCCGNCRECSCNAAPAAVITDNTLPKPERPLSRVKRVQLDDIPSRARATVRRKENRLDRRSVRRELADWTLLERAM